MARTVFYSWQSDSPNSTNRRFIEDALNAALALIASDDTVLPADRNEDIVIDKDIQGVPGSPPVADTILNKIEIADAFVADVTYVGRTNDGKKHSPNSNVMIEYGYAIRALTHSRVVKVMNTHFGSPKEFPLPFDMQHVRFPICYDLPEKPTAENRQATLKSLARDLASALKLILDAGRSDEVVAPVSFTPMASEFVKYSFLAPGAPLLTLRSDFDGRAEGVVQYDDGAAMSLRVFPSIAVEPVSGMDLADVAKKSIGPLGPPQGGNWGRNEHGFVVYHFGQDPHKATRFVQLFESGEIWSVNLGDLRYDVVQGFEQFYPAALAQYAKFIREVFQYEGELSWIAGIHGIKNLPVMLPPAPAGKMRIKPTFGAAHKGQIEVHGKLPAGGDPRQVLTKFLEAVWANFDIKRSDLIADGSLKA